MTKYSVLMSVYAGDDPLELSESVNSMLSQTVAPDEIVLVCDGALKDETESVILGFGEKLKVVRLQSNSGLGVALRHGIGHCRNELIARMDSDDVSLPDRCEKQLKEFERDRDLCIVSGSIEEFGDMRRDTGNKRCLPLAHDEIVAFSKKRNPFNHPAVMFKKSEVLRAGNYTEEYHLFEDYDLWIRMLANGSVGKNLPDVLLKMRVDESHYRRRGGFSYAKDMLRFHRHLKRTHWIGSFTYLTCAMPHALICVMPSGVRRQFYRILRKS